MSALSEQMRHPIGRRGGEGAWPNHRSASLSRKVGALTFLKKGSLGGVYFVWGMSFASRCHTLSGGITVSTLAWRGNV